MKDLDLAKNPIGNRIASKNDKKTAAATAMLETGGMILGHEDGDEDDPAADDDPSICQ